MKKLISYKQFINEKYIENPEFKIKTFFEQLTNNINKWFTEGTFAANGSELGKITTSQLYDTEKNLIFEFSDENNYYQVYVIVSLEDITEDTINDCYVKIKKYTDDGKLLGTHGEDVLINNLKEDKIVELLSKLDENLEKGTYTNTEEIDNEQTEDESEFGGEAPEMPQGTTVQSQTPPESPVQ